MKRVFPLVLITLGILLGFGAISQLYLNNRQSGTATINLPNGLAGLRLTDTQSGAEGIAAFTSLHGKEFPVTSGAIGIYGNRKATL